jgi:hypothetical protein
MREPYIHTVNASEEELRCPKVLFSRNKSQADQGRVQEDESQSLPIGGIIGQNGTGKSRALRWLARSLCGSVDSHEPVGCFLWRQDGTTFMWAHPDWPAETPEFATRAEGPPECKVFYMDQASTFGSQTVFGDETTVEPHHNLSDASALAFIHRDANISATDGDHFLDGSATVNLGEVFRRFYSGEILRQAAVLSHLQNYSKITFGFLQSIRNIRSLNARPREATAMASGVAKDLLGNSSDFKELSETRRSEVAGSISEWIDGLSPLNRKPSRSPSYRWAVSCYWHNVAKSVRHGPHNIWALSSIQRITKTRLESDEWLLGELAKLSQELFRAVRYFIDNSEVSGNAFFDFSKSGDLPDELISIIGSDIENRFIEMSWASDLHQRVPLSSGERALWSLAGRLHDCLTKERSSLGHHQVLLIDEPETSLHPSWQRSYLYELTAVLEALKSNIHAVYIATHSPLIVSDLDTGAVNCLSLHGLADHPAIKVLTNDGFDMRTYASTPDALLYSVFRMPDILIGVRAEQSLKRLINDIEGLEESVKRGDVQRAERSYFEFERQANEFVDHVLQIMLRERLKRLRETIMRVSPKIGDRR